MTRNVSCSGAIFVEENGKDLRILLEDRRKFSKHGEHWSFFGGHSEEGEDEIDTLVREIKEELDYNIKEYKFFKKYEFDVNGIHFTYHMYSAKMPKMSQIHVHKEAYARKFTIRQALRLKMINIDKDIIKDVQHSYLNSNLNI